MVWRISVEIILTRMHAQQGGAPRLGSCIIGK